MAQMAEALPIAGNQATTIRGASLPFKGIIVFEYPLLFPSCKVLTFFVAPLF